MTNVFGEKEKQAAKKEKQVLFWVWFAVLVVAVAVVATCAIVATYRVSVLRDRSLTALLGSVAAIVAILFSCYSLFFFSIKYKLTRKFVKMLREMDRGLKDEFDAKFIGYDDSVTMKDGVYFYSMVLKTKPLRRDDIDERKLLVEQTVPKLKLNSGAKLKLISHANILVSYEIIDNSPPAEKEEAISAESEAETPKH